MNSTIGGTGCDATRRMLRNSRGSDLTRGCFGRDILPGLRKARRQHDRFCPDSQDDGHACRRRSDLDRAARHPSGVDGRRRNSLLAAPALCGSSARWCRGASAFANPPEGCMVVGDCNPQFAWRFAGRSPARYVHTLPAMVRRPDGCPSRHSVLISDGPARQAARIYISPPGEADAPPATALTNWPTSTWARISPALGARCRAADPRPGRAKRAGNPNLALAGRARAIAARSPC